MIPDFRHSRGMTDRSDNSTFLLPGMHSPEQIDSTLMDLDPQSFSLAISSLLERAFNLLSQFHWIHSSWSHLNLIGHSDDPFEPQHRLLGILPLMPEIDITLERYPTLGYR